MGKGRLRKVKSSVQLDYIAGVGTGWNRDISETSWVNQNSRYPSDANSWLLGSSWLSQMPPQGARLVVLRLGLDYDRDDWAFFAGLQFNRPAVSDLTPRGTVGSPCYRAQGSGPYVQMHMLQDGKWMPAQSWGFLTWSQTNLLRLICQLP